ncbi:hypothetical protein FOCC_FOCC006743 [Frankliniella occidentalis]|nr:hypothetical protein FOCC_FOCC006743 [Frankliniella occidentalis]
MWVINLVLRAKDLQTLKMEQGILKLYACLLVCLVVSEWVIANDEQDHYKVLGVEKTATKRQIKKAYKQLALKYHPDKVRGDKSKKKAAEEKFFKINQAYETLSDPNKKKLYDMQKSGNPNPFTSGYGGQQFNGHAGHDFGFDSMFFENFGRPQRPFHFAPEFQQGAGNYFSFDNLFPEDHHPFFEDHSFGDGSSFFGSHFGGHAGHHHENHYAHHSGHHSEHSRPRQHQSHFSHHHAQQRSCRTVTQRVDNVVTTFMQCS